MKVVKQLKSLKLDTYLIGLDMCNEDQHYWCTPVGAQIIGWECDGIHYCFIDRFGEMVFAVNPMPLGNHHAYPLAKNFTDFLRLILATGSTTAIEQITGWDKGSFETFINSEEERAHFLSPEVTAVLNGIREEFQLTPMENPFEYVKDVQEHFDPSTIPFSNEYYDTLYAGEEQEFEWTTVILQPKK